jgi:lipoic acid synthetase
MQKKQQKPQWLKTKIPDSQNFFLVKKILKEYNLKTVCEEAKCPNISHCWSKKTATFMILGNTCTRNCRFCAVKKGNPSPIDPSEPNLIAKAIKSLGIKHAVITSVTRDDLPDGGASIFSKTIKINREINPDVKIEVLIPDFNGSKEALYEVIKSRPDILNHNIEAVAQIYPKINRPLQFYHRSLWILRESKKNGLITKSGLMVGLGETKKDIIDTLKDLKNGGCDIVTIGQYLQPTKNHLPVEKYYSPQEFEEIKMTGKEIGLSWIEAGPLVRSSFHARIIYNTYKMFQH